MGIFYRGKAFNFTLGKKSGKINLPPLKNIPVTPLCQIPRYKNEQYLVYYRMRYYTFPRVFPHAEIHAQMCIHICACISACGNTRKMV